MQNEGQKQAGGRCFSHGVEWSVSHTCWVAFVDQIKPPTLSDWGEWASLPNTLILLFHFQHHSGPWSHCDFHIMLNPVPPKKALSWFVLYLLHLQCSIERTLNKLELIEATLACNRNTEKHHSPHFSADTPKKGRVPKTQWWRRPEEG